MGPMEGMRSKKPMGPAGHMWLLERMGPLGIHGNDGINEGPWVRAHEAHMIPLGTYVRSQRSTP